MSARRAVEVAEIMHGRIIFLLHLVGSAAERADVTADGSVSGLPLDAIMSMRGAELGATMAKWAEEEFEVPSLLMQVFFRISLLGNMHGPMELDAFVDAAGDGLTALIRATTMHTCGWQSDDPSSMVVLGALGALGTLSTGGINGQAWKESSAGLMRCTRLSELGALNATVIAMNAAGFDMTACSQAWNIQRAGLHVIASVCLGHDGHEGLGLPNQATREEAMAGLPSEASFRRETAAAAGAIEAIIGVTGALRDCISPCGLKKTEARGMLDIALRALQRVILGHETAGKTRRTRAAEAHVIPAMVGALDRAARSGWFSKDLMQQVIQTNMILMGQDDPEGDGRADPALDREWQAEIAKRPALAAKMQAVMAEAYRQDPERVRRAHAQAGHAMPEGLG